MKLSFGNRAGTYLLAHDDILAFLGLLGRLVHDKL